MGCYLPSCGTCHFWTKIRDGLRSKRTLSIISFESRQGSRGDARKSIFWILFELSRVLSIQGLCPSRVFVLSYPGSFPASSCLFETLQIFLNGSHSKDEPFWPAQPHADPFNSQTLFKIFTTTTTITFQRKSMSNHYSSTPPTELAKTQGTLLLSEGREKDKAKRELIKCPTASQSLPLRSQVADSLLSSSTPVFHCATSVSCDTLLEAACIIMLIISS